MRTFSGERRGSMVNFRCWVSASPKPRYRAICLLEADGRDNRGGLFFATKPWRSVTASITRGGLGETVAYGVSPIGLNSSDPGLRRLRRYGLGSGAALGDHSPPRTIEESVFGPLSAITESHIALPQYRADQEER